jgi:hypothetical protein
MIYTMMEFLSLTALAGASQLLASVNSSRLNVAFLLKEPSSLKSSMANRANTLGHPSAVSHIINFKKRTLFIKLLNIHVSTVHVSTVHIHTELTQILYSVRACGYIFTYFKLTCVNYV